MVKVNKDCLDEAMKSLINFSKDELEDYINDVFDRASQYGDIKNSAAYDRAIKEVNDEYLQSYFEDATNKANDLLKFRRKQRMIENKKNSVKNFVLPRNDKGVSLSENIVQAQAAHYEKFIAQIMDGLDEKEKIKFYDSADEQDIISEIDGNETNNPYAKKMAKKWNDYRENSNSELVISGALNMKDIRNDRFMRAIHDQTKITLAGKNLSKIAMDKKKFSMEENRDLWKKSFRPLFNAEESFHNIMDADGNVDEAKVDKILNKMYDSITTGKSDIFTRSAVVNDKEAVQNRRRMKIVWNSMGDQYAYNKIFGRGNFTQMWLRDAHSSASKVGMAEQFGSSPYSMFADLRKAQQDVNPKGVKYWFETDTYFNSLTRGEVDVNPTLTNFISNAKMVTAMARLGTLGISSFDDLAYVAAFGHRSGVGFYKSFLNAASHAFNSFPTEERIKVAKLMQTQLDAQLGHIGRYTDQNNVSAVIRNASTKFFKAFGLTAWDDGNRISSMALMGKELANNSGKKFHELNPYMREYTEKFLTSDEWDLLRSKNKGGFFSTENVDALTNDEIKAHHAKIGSDEPLSWVKNDLYRKVHSMFMINGENAVLTPSAFENAWLRGGQAKGSPGETLTSIFTQYKSYPLAFIDRVLVGGWKDADTAGRKLIWGTSLLMMSIPLSIASRFVKDLSQNKTMPDPSKMNVPELEKYIIESIAPALGQFASVLDSKQSPYMKAIGLLSNPLTSLLGNVMATVVPWAICHSTESRRAWIIDLAVAKRRDQSHGDSPPASEPFEAIPNPFASLHRRFCQ